MAKLSGSAKQEQNAQRGSLARHGLQAVWLEVVNGGEEPLWLDRVQLDPNYYTPLEAAHLVHFAMSKRLVAFGLLGWLFLPLLPLVPLKLLGVRAVNQQSSTWNSAPG